MSSCYSSYASTQTRAADTSKLQQQLFSKVDANGDKSIDQTELTSFLDYVGEKTGSSIDSAAALKALDSDGNGSISETELTDNASALFDQLKSQLMSSQMQLGSAPPPPPPPKEDSSQMFSSIDTDGDGSISKTELESFVSSRSGESGQGSSVDDILARDDADGDGSISSTEFEDAMSSRRPQRHGGGGDGGGMNFEKLLSSLVSQYTAVSSAASTTSSLSIAA
jgi:Ca2+-binding EF-hand superfamily protein